MAEQEAVAITPRRGAVHDLLEFVGETTLLAWSAVTYLLRGQFSMREAVRQMAVLGADSLPIVLLTVGSTGAVMSLYTVGIFITYGAVNLIGGTIAIAFLLELAPLLAGVAFASRTAAAIAAELGSMVVTEQIDALRALAVSPVRHLVAPRVLACVLMLPVATVFADLAGIGGGMLMAAAHGVPQSTFIESIRNFAVPSDLLKGLVKTFWFGFTIAVVACRQGLRTKGGASGVGRATTSSVVACVVLVFICDFVLAQMLGALSGGRR